MPKSHSRTRKLTGRKKRKRPRKDRKCEEPGTTINPLDPVPCGRLRAYAGDLSDWLTSISLQLPSGRLLPETSVIVFTAQLRINHLFHSAHFSATRPLPADIQQGIAMLLGAIDDDSHFMRRDWMQNWVLYPHLSRLVFAWPALKVDPLTTDPVRFLHACKALDRIAGRADESPEGLRDYDRWVPARQIADEYKGITQGMLTKWAKAGKVPRVDATPKDRGHFHNDRLRYLYDSLAVSKLVNSAD